MIANGSHFGGWSLYLDAGRIALARREAHVGQSVSHSHLTSILSARLDGPPYYLVPRSPGGPLQRFNSLDFGLSTPMWLLFSW